MSAVRDASESWPAALACQWLPDADHWLQVLESEVTWTHESLVLYGKTIAVPRQVAWFGDPGISYRYSGVDHTAAGWSASTLALRDWIAQQYQVPFNFVLLNRYRTGRDYMGWHADDEQDLLGDVCSLSLGATRRFLLEPESGERFGINLSHGSVVRIPRRWRHSLAKTAKGVGPRINLSFRQVGATL